MDGDVEKGNVSSGYNYTNIHTVYHQIVLKSFMDYNGRDDMDMDDNLQNGDVSS